MIRKEPTSDKIGEAALRAAGICEYFSHFTIAVLYYQRAYQWDPENTYPARFKAAYILDKRMARRMEALELYRQSVELEKLSRDYKGFAVRRIKELTRMDERAE